MMKLAMLVVLAMSLLVSGCALDKIIINGSWYQPEWLKTVEEVDKKASDELAKNSDVGIGISYINTKYLPEKDTVKNTSGWGNSVVAKLTFNKKVEMIRKRSGADEKYWLRDVLMPAYNNNPLLLETCKTYWSGTHTTTDKENKVVYSKDLKNYSLLTDSTMIGINLTKAKDLPLDDVCSVKSAELYLVKLAEDVAARTEEYVKK